MAFLNKDERDKLLNEIKDLSFNRIKGRLRSKDKRCRLAFYRNVQETDRWMTRYILDGLGTQVTLVESLDDSSGKAKYNLVEIIVQPTPENRL
jgi:hypothetical protein